MRDDSQAQNNLRVCLKTRKALFSYGRIEILDTRSSADDWTQLLSRRNWNSTLLWRVLEVAQRSTESNQRESHLVCMGQGLLLTSLGRSDGLIHSDNLPSPFDSIEPVGHSIVESPKFSFT